MPQPNLGHGSIMTATDKLATLRAQHALMVRVGADARDPYPHLGAVRRSHPVFVATNDSPRGVGVLALGHGVVQTVLRDASRFSSSILTEALGPSTANARVLVSQDDPEHRVHRALVSRAFSSSAIDRLADDLMTPVADQLDHTTLPRYGFPAEDRFAEAFCGRTVGEEGGGRHVHRRRCCRAHPARRRNRVVDATLTRSRSQ